MIRLIRPEAYYVSVLDIDPDDLVARGYRAVLLDLDNTLQPRNESRVPLAVSRWVDSLKDAGLGVAIITNTDNDRVMRAAKDLNVHLVRKAFKPMTGAYITACACLGVACSDAVMVGDQSYTDILGAHRAGMDGFMVMPQSSADPFHTFLLRAIDALAVRGMRPTGGSS